jgi:hypothetical protein
MVPPSDVLRKTTSYEGVLDHRLRQLASGWDSEVFDLLGRGLSFSSAFLQSPGQMVNFKLPS